MWINLAAPEFASKPEPPITCGLIYRRKRHVLIGPPEAAKTLAALIVGLEHMRGGHGPFALVDLEMGEHATRLLLEELGATADEIRGIWYATPEAPPQQDDLDQLADAGVTLVIIDAAAGAYGVSALDDNKRADAERFGQLWVEPLWRRDIATLLLDHVVKNSDNRGRFAIGSERKLGGVDVALGLEAVKQLHRGGRGLIRITTHKDRPGHLPRPRAAEFELRSDPDTHRITWTFRPASDDDPDADTWRPTVLMDRVLEHVNHPFYEPQTRNAIANAVRGKREYVLQAIDLLLEDGQLALDGKRVVPVPRNVPGTSSHSEGNGNVPRSSLLTEGNAFQERLSQSQTAEGLSQ
jgi:hypothetical protein